MAVIHGIKEKYHCVGCLPITPSGCKPSLPQRLFVSASGSCCWVPLLPLPAPAGEASQDLLIEEYKGLTCASRGSPLRGIGYEQKPLQWHHRSCSPSAWSCSFPSPCRLSCLGRCTASQNPPAYKSYGPLKTHSFCKLLIKESS